MKRPLVYLAGPYTKPDPVANTAKAMSAWDRMWDGGIAPICPHWSMIQHLHQAREWEVWLAYDFDLIDRCDALLRMPGESQGADAEVVHANKLGIPVFTSEDEVLGWARLWHEEHSR